MRDSCGMNMTGETSEDGVRGGSAGKGSSGKGNGNISRDWVFQIAALHLIKMISNI